MAEKKKILVCDDDKNIRESYKLILEGAYELIFCDRGINALAYLEEGNPVDLVLMDISMPKMDGLTALKEVKRLRPNLPVIMVTGYELVEMAAATTQAGAFDYIVKPFEPEDLQKSIARALSAPGQP